MSEIYFINYNIFGISVQNQKSFVVIDNNIIMAKFVVYKFSNEENYRKAMKLKEDIEFSQYNHSDGYLNKDEQLREMLNYCDTKVEFDSYSDLSDYLDENEYTIYEEKGELEEQVICSKCGAKMYTNSQERLDQARDIHQIQVCPEDKGR